MYMMKVNSRTGVPLFELPGYDRRYKRIVLSNGCCSCKADAHACVEEGLTTSAFCGKEVAVSTLLENVLEEMVNCLIVVHLPCWLISAD